MKGGNLLAIQRLDGPFGAEVRGLDFRDPGEEVIGAFERALRQHSLLVCRRQESPSAEQMRYFFSHLGALNFDTAESRNHYEVLFATGGVENPADVY